MSKEISYVVKRKIDFIPVIGDVQAYREEVYHEEELVSTVEGLALLQDLEKVTGSKPIQKFSKNILPKEQNVPAGLFKKELRTIIRTTPMGFDSVFGKIEECEISNPYSYVLENGLEDVEIFFLFYYNHSVFDFEGNMLPKAIFFDYISGHMDNGHYDLELVFEELKKRNDIDWLTSEPKIESIPYYNASRNRNKCLKFVWMPSDEDFETIKHSLDKSFGRHDAIASTIFGFTRKEFDYCDE